MSDVIPLCVQQQQQQQQQQQRHQQVCVQLPTPADNATLLAFAAERRAAAAPGGRRDRSISPARRAHSSKPAVAACGGQMMGLIDGQELAPGFYQGSNEQYRLF